MNNLWRIIIAVFTICFLMAGPCFGLTIKEEKELGDKFILEMFAHLEIIDDPVICSYVDKVGRQVLKAVGDQPFEYHFYVVNEHVFNAFAGPGGHIFINSGLLAAMDTEDELAGILAHEIAHVSSRHISEKIARQSKIQLATLAGMLAGVFLGAMPLAVISPAVGTSTVLAYSREDERQADEVGIKYLSDAGYNAAGLLSGLKKIRKAQWFGPDDVPGYLMTHPAVDERLSYLDTWLAVHPDQAKKRSEHRYKFNKIRARTIALYGDKDHALKQLGELVKILPDDPYALYGLGLIQGRMNHNKKAITSLRRAIELRPFDLDILIALGQAYLQNNRLKEAARLFESAVKKNPEKALGQFYLGRVRLVQGNLPVAEKHLRKALSLMPNNNKALYFMGKVLGKEGKNAEAHFFLGLFNLRQQDKKNAVWHLNHALELVKNDDVLEKRIKKELNLLTGQDKILIKTGTK